MFTSTQLAARIEKAECQLLKDAVEAIVAQAPESDLFLRDIAGGVAAFTIEGMPFNKLAGLGFDGVPDESELGAVEEAFRRRGAKLPVEVSSVADPRVAALLSRRGYTLEGIENVSGRTLPAPDLETSPGPGVDLSRPAIDDLDAWTDIVVTGFGTPDEEGVPSHESFESDLLKNSIRYFSHTRGMRHYLVTRDGEPAGGGSMRLTDGIAQLCGAATLPTHRRRGIQTLLLGRRLADASAEGCDLAVVTTQPGSKSHENVCRRGFVLLYTRTVLVKEP